MENRVLVSLYAQNYFDFRELLTCHRRIAPCDYQVPHLNPKTKVLIPGPHYEVEVTPVLKWILDQDSYCRFFNPVEHFGSLDDFKKYREKLVSGLHIEIGKDALPYICCPNLPEENLLLCIKLWLAHQGALKVVGIGIGFFEGFVLHENSDFEDWLENGSCMDAISPEKKDFLRLNSELFKKVRSIYYCIVRPQNHYSINDFVDCVAKMCCISLQVKGVWDDVWFVVFTTLIKELMR